MANIKSHQSSYVFENARPQAEVRFATVAEMYDPGTLRHLTDLQVGEGWRCLEVGGGGGTILSWLCDRVSPAGEVTATDIDTRYLERLVRPNLIVQQHDIVSDPLPEAYFDLVHTRLVLMHIPEREQVLRRLIAALKPGGWILAEEFDSLSVRSDLLADPVETLFKTFDVMYKVMADRGVDLRYGRVLASQMRNLGLAAIAAEGRAFIWHGRSTAAEMFRANVEQLRGAILDTGLITDEEVDHDLSRLADDKSVFPSPIMWAVRGRRP